MSQCASFLIRPPKELAPSIAIMTGTCYADDSVLTTEVREIHNAVTKGMGFGIRDLRFVF